MSLMVEAPPKPKQGKPTQGGSGTLPPPPKKTAMEVVTDFLDNMDGRTDSKVASVSYNETPRAHEAMRDFGLREQEVVTIRVVVSRRK